MLYRWVVQGRRNSSALAMELCLSCTNPSIWYIRSSKHRWVVRLYSKFPFIFSRLCDKEITLIIYLLCNLWTFWLFTHALRRWKNYRHFADGIFKLSLLNQISLGYVHRGVIDKKQHWFSFIAYGLVSNKRQAIIGPASLRGGRFIKMSSG